MALQSINLGATGTGAGGDTARTAFEKINANFSNPAHAASKLVQTSPTDTTAGALMAVGAFGLGGNSPVTDYNNPPTANSFIYAGSSATPNRPGVGSTYALNMAANALYGHQLGAGVAENELRFRNNNNGTWGAWNKLFHTGNILGTVSQAGGVPTGAIIERGSNANGEYVRFADGTQICTYMGVVSGSWSAGLTLERAWTFPAPFASTAGLIADCTQGNSTGADLATSGWDSWLHVLSTTSARFGVKNTGTVAQAGTLSTYFAIGRWY